MFRIKVGTYKGNEIFYNAGEKRFTSDVFDIEITAPTQEELEKKIDAALKASGLFPVKVIRVESRVIQYGRITTYDPETKRFWFVRDDGQREMPWNANYYFLDTVGNRVIAGEIQSLAQEIDRISKQIDDRKQSLEKPVDEYYKEAQAKLTA